MSDLRVTSCPSWFNGLAGTSRALTTNGLRSGRLYNISYIASSSLPSPFKRHDLAIAL